MEQHRESSANNMEVLFLAQEVFARIQFPLLIEIFNKKLGRAQRPTKEFSPSMIRFDLGAPESAFSGNEIIIGLRELIPEGVPGRKLEIFFTIVHEMAHYFSLGEQNVSYAQHGVSLVESSTSEPISGEGLNEAITEFSAMEIVQAYIAQTGERAYFYGDEDGERLLATIGAFAYPAQIKVLQVAIKKIAQSQGVDESQVWESFQHAYYNNTNVALGELYTALKVALGKDATSQLVRTSSENMEDIDVLNGLLRRLEQR